MKVKKNNKLALINESKKLINQDQYNEIKQDQELYEVKKDGRFNLIKKNGSYILPEWVDWIGESREMGSDQNNKSVGKGYVV